MKYEMEDLSSYLSSASWLIDESRTAKWTQAENKIFENALAVYDKDTPDRWQKVAAMLPGKNVGDVIKQYKELEDDVSNIEAGLVPIPGYDTASAFTLEWVNHNGYDGYNHTYSPGGKRGPGTRPAEQERKKGVPWTEEEHKLFLMGLKKYGKGDWRNISRNFVVTRTPTQVASHAQKYFIRQLSGGKDKRRASIHDITTVNIENDPLSPDTNSNSKRSNSPDHSTITLQTPHQVTSASMLKTQFHWDSPNNGAAIAFESMPENVFISQYGNSSYGFKMQGQNFQRDDLETYLRNQGMGFQVQPSEHYPHG
ncbi:transcription factor DIVARICATA-like [Silene latifolia]|uniref:transcription factor DIVARICATA-like n=1 Tax=Silene latifolia TaxID=37657 RepID=UPI003D77EC92